MSAPRRTFEPRHSPHRAGAWFGLLLGLAILAPEAAWAGYSYITARGRAIYHDDNGLPVGIKHAKVRVWDTDWFFPCGVLGGCRELIGEGETDGDGYFAVSGSGSDDWCMTYVPGTFICAIGVSDDPDPYVEIEASSVSGAVQTAGLAPATYCFKSGYLDNVPNNVGVQFGEISPDSPGAYPWQGPGGGCSAGEDVSGDDAAWQLFNNLRESWEFVRTYSLANPGASGADTAGEIPPVRVFWPDLGSFYRPAIPLLDQGAISIQAGDEWNEATVMHEYGHHVLYHFAESPFPNYNNGNYDGTPLPFFDDGHGVWAWEHGSIHWTEGWPDYLSEVLTTHYGKDNTASATWGSGGSFENPPVPEDTNYRLIEGYTAAILWDLSDPVNTAEDHDANGSKDRLAEDFGVQWDVLVNYDPAPAEPSHNHPVTIDEFWAGFAAFHPSLAGRLSEIYDENHITDKPKPDLRVVALGNPPASINRGLSFTVADTTGNAGNAGGGTASVTRFFLSADGLITTSDVPIGERVVPELGGMGSNSNAVTTVTVPLWLPTGPYLLGACADASDHLYEANETNNCNAAGVVQVQLPTLQVQCFVDADGDGVRVYGPEWVSRICSVLASVDCDDQNPAIPGPEVCDGLDNDCDGFIDQGLLETYWVDFDADGYGGGKFPDGLYCSAPPGRVTNHSDCNDQDRWVHPGAPEICDGVDNDCDGLADEGLALVYYPDADGDGYGVLGGQPVRACSAVPGHATRARDCNDASAAIHPGAAEGPYGNASCADGVDNDCDGAADGADPGCLPVHDLAMTSLTPPRVVPFGLAMVVGFTVRNAGHSVLPDSVTRLYGSADNKSDAADSVLASVPTPALAPGEESTLTLSVTVPTTYCNSGFFLLARADATKLILEEVESNNWRSKKVGFGSDLLVSALALRPGATAASMNVTDTTRNLGACETPGATATEYYLSANKVLDPADVLLGQRVVPSLLAGGESTGTASVTIPAATAPGSYYIVAKAVDGYPGGVNYFGDTRAKAVDVRPDLAVASVTPPATATRGATVSIASKVRNQGRATAAASTTRIHLSTDTSYGAGDVLLGQRAVPSLAAGALNAGPTTVTIPAGTPPGAYYVIAVSDATGSVDELNEGNNVRAVPLGVDP